MFRRRSKIELKTAAQFDLMRLAGLVVARALNEMRDEVRPGIRTDHLDEVARGVLAREGATSSFLGYHGFPAVVCLSVNDEVVHGIPGDRVLHDGDVISIDFGAIVEGWHGDAAVTVGVGQITPVQAALITDTEDSLWAGIAATVAGARLSDIGHAVETLVRSRSNYGVIEEYVGHGIGTSMHMEPSVPNYGDPGHGPVLEVGMALAIEPMVVLGERYVHTLADNWTVVTDDGSLAAHWEHTVAITEQGPWVLTALDGGATRLGALGAAKASDLSE
jgi:methionyl aminopeptidase